MNEDRRDIFKKLGLLGASALALAGVSQNARKPSREMSNRTRSSACGI